MILPCDISSTKTDGNLQDGTFCTKTVQKMVQDGTSSTKTDGNLQDGTSSIKTDHKFQDGNLQGGTSSTNTKQKFQDRNLQDGISSTKVSKVAKIRNRYNQVPHLTQDTNGKVTNSQKTPQTRAKRSALSQQVTTKHI